MLEVTVFRAEMDLVKANMLVLSDLTGALAGGEHIFLESESLGKSEIEDEDVSEEIDKSEDVDDPDRKPSSSAVTLSSQMDESLTLSFPSIMLGLKTEMVNPRLYPLFTFPAYYYFKTSQSTLGSVCPTIKLRELRDGHERAKKKLQKCHVKLLIMHKHLCQW